MFTFWHKSDKLKFMKKYERKPYIRQGINMAGKELNNDDEMFVTLTLDDDTEVECIVITIFEADGKDYIALLPIDDENEDEGEVYLYRYSEDAEGNPILDNIESDDEYEVVADRFDEWLDEQEYDEIVGEDEE